MNIINFLLFDTRKEGLDLMNYRIKNFAASNSISWNNLRLRLIQVSSNALECTRKVISALHVNLGA